MPHPVCLQPGSSSASRAAVRLARAAPTANNMFACAAGGYQLAPTAEALGEAVWFWVPLQYALLLASVADVCNPRCAFICGLS